MKGKFRYLVGLLAVFALVAAACGGGGEPPEAGPLGQVVVEEGDSIQIRSFNAITGDVAFLGIPNQRGVELAIADYGDIKGFSVDMGTGAKGSGTGLSIAYGCGGTDVGSRVQVTKTAADSWTFVGSEACLVQGLDVYDATLFPMPFSFTITSQP